MKEKQQYTREEQPKHRGHNEGTIGERRNKAGDITGYQAQVSVAGGRRSQTFKTEREARRWIREAQAQAAAGRLAPKRPPTLGEYLDKTWLKTMRESVGSRTLASYTLNVKRVPPSLGATRLDDLRPAHFQSFYEELTAAGKAPRTVRQIHRTLHKAMKDALPLDLITRNPTEGVTLPRIPHAEPCWYTGDELASLFAATDGDRFHALWVVLGTLGLRLGEALGLKWSDIDWGRATLTVQRALQRDRFGRGLLLKETKTKRSRRTLTMIRDVRAALQAHHDRQDFERKQAREAWHAEDLVFCTSIGTPLDQQRVSVHWSRACEKAGLPRYRLHDLRHSWASLQLAGGVPVERLARMGGWSSVTMLFEVYGHILPADFRDGAAVMEDVLARARAKS